MPIYHTKNAYPDNSFNELMDVLDNIKEHLTDAKYLELCNKLKKSYKKKTDEKYTYVGLQINENVKDIIQRKHPEMIKMCDNIILKINKDLPDWYETLKYAYIKNFIEKFEDNLLKLVFNKITNECGRVHFERMKQEYPKKTQREIMIYMLADNDCDCCALVKLDTKVRVAKFMTEEEFDDTIQLPTDASLVL